MAASCNLLHLPFPKTLIPRPLPTSISSRRPILSISSSSSSAGASIESAAAAAVYPALKHANVLFFQSGYNVQIVVDENESDEALLRRFRREVSKVGVVQECKRRRYFENKQEEKKRKKQEAGRRNRRRRLGPRFNASSSSPADVGAAANKAKEDADDNWDLPEGVLPY